MKRITLSKPLTLAFSGVRNIGKDPYTKDGRSWCEHYADIFCQALGTTYRAIFSKEGGGLLLPDGNWTGMVGLVNRSEADIAVEYLYITEERKEAVSYSYPNYYGGHCFVTRKPEYHPNALSVFLPFSRTVWLILIACILLMIMALYFVLRRKESPSNVALVVLATTLGQELIIKSGPRNRGKKILFMSWLVGSTIIGMCYKSILLSVLTLPDLKGVRNLQELADAVERGEYNCMTYKGGIIPNLLTNSSDESEKIIGYNMQRNPYGKGMVEDFLKLSNNKIAFIGLRFDLDFLSDRYYVSDDSFYPSLFGLLVNKNFCCKEQLDIALNRVTQSGVLSKFERDYNFMVALRSIPPDIEEKKRSNLSLIELNSAFIILIAGHILACIVLIAELILNKSR